MPAKKSKYRQTVEAGLKEPDQEPAPVEVATEDAEPKEPTYFEKRMAELGITPEINKISICYYDAELKDNAWRDEPIFTPSDRGIDILVYHIEGYLINYAKEGSRFKNKVFRITRFEHPKVNADGKEYKYDLPKGQPAYPFFPPAIVEKYKNKAEIDTLYLTEGYFKAFKGAMHGIDVVGLASINTLEQKDTGKLHEDILLLISECKVKKVVFLMDGDCLEPLKAGAQEIYLDEESGRENNLYANGKDLRQRPFLFFSQVKRFKKLLDEVDVEKYFMHIKSDEIENHPKGLDDLLVEFHGREDIIAEHIKIISRTTTYFHPIEISRGDSRLWEYFKLGEALPFFNYHVEKRPLLKKKLFTFNGTRYKWLEDKHNLEIVKHGDSNNYIRVGDTYYEKVEWVNKLGGTELQLERRQKGTIVDDYGKPFIKDINKYKIFCNLPDNVNYQQTPYYNYNLYYPFEWQPQEGECPHTLEFLKHIFGTGTISCKHPKTGELITVNELDLGLDYVQLLYQNPTQTLPILCLVSKENETGKTTFGKWLQKIFKRNAVIVGNQDLSNDFNGHWLPRLIVICDETKIDKQVVIEKVKSLSTGGKAFMNSKGKDQVEIEIFCKFIFNSNNEDNFIYAHEEDIRWWIRKIPRISNDKRINQIEDVMAEEIPAFLDMLQKRKMATENLSRAWFYPDLLKTEALKKVVQASKSGIEKELREKIRSKFLKHNITELQMDLEDIQTHFFRGRKQEDSYLRRVLKESMKVDTWTDPATGKKRSIRYEFPGMEPDLVDGKIGEKEVTYRKQGRPFVFTIRSFFTDEEINEMELGIDVNTLPEAPQPKPIQTEIDLPLDNPDAMAFINGND